MRGKMLASVAILAVGLAAASAASEMKIGLVVSISDRTLVVADDGGGNQQTFTIPAETLITLNNKPAKLEEITAGDMVTVKTETRDGKTEVTALDAKSAKDKLLSAAA